MKNLIDRPNRHNIVLDVTYECNIRCPDCDRYCTDAPGGTESRMTVEQVARFVQEVIKENHHWKVVKLSGGEPLIHPDIFDIVLLLHPLLKKEKTDQIVLLTNGFSPAKASGLPSWLVVENSMKNVSSRSISFHEKIGPAPVDINMPFNLDVNQCQPTEFGCAICLNAWGYYLTSPCAAVDRIFGLDVGVRSLKEILESKYVCLEEQQKSLCQYCGHVTTHAGIKGEPSRILKSMFRRAASASVGMTRY
jgi:hypothetical protein